MSEIDKSKESQDSNVKEEQPVEPTKQEATTVDTSKTMESDDDINKLISDIEKDMELKKEKLFTETKEKFDKEYGTKFADKDKEIAKLKEKISSLESTYKETTQKVIDDYKNEMKAKFDAIEKEISTRQSMVPNQGNPFRNSDEKLDKDWFNRKDLSDEEKYKLFERYTLKK